MKIIHIFIVFRQIKDIQGLTREITVGLTTNMEGQELHRCESKPRSISLWNIICVHVQFLPPGHYLLWVCSHFTSFLALTTSFGHIHVHIISIKIRHLPMSFKLYLPNLTLKIDHTSTSFLVEFHCYCISIKFVIIIWFGLFALDYQSGQYLVSIFIESQ